MVTWVSLWCTFGVVGGTLASLEGHFNRFGGGALEMPPATNLQSSAGAGRVQGGCKEGARRVQGGCREGARRVRV